MPTSSAHARSPSAPTEPISLKLADARVTRHYWHAGMIKLEGTCSMSGIQQMHAHSRNSQPAFHSLAAGSLGIVIICRSIGYTCCGPICCDREGPGMGCEEALAS